MALPAFARNQYAFSMRDLKIRRAGTIVTLPAAQQFNVSPMVVSGILRGSSKIVAANSYIEGAEAAFGVGGLPLDAMPLMLGTAAPAVTGSTPNRQQTYNILAGGALPYFEVIGRSEDGEGGDVHLYVPRCKIMSNFTLQIQDGANFMAPQMTVNCVPDASGLAIRILSNETAAEIVFPTPTATIALTDIDVAGNIATATSASAHGLTAGAIVGITGATANYINGIKQVITASGSTLTFIAVGADVSNQTGSLVIP